MSAVTFRLAFDGSAAVGPPSSPFGPRPGIGSDFHWGGDWPVRYVPLYAMEPGRVVLVDRDPAGAEGLAVGIRIDEGPFRGWYYSYSHMSAVHVVVGDRASAGELLGVSGNTGHVVPSRGGDGAHVHVGVKDPGGEWVNPATVVPGARGGASGGAGLLVVGGGALLLLSSLLKGRRR